MRRASAPAASAWLDRSIASAVLLEPAPAMTGTRPFASSTQTSTTLLCSAWLSVGLSPVVPTGTRPCVPSAICQLTRSRKAFSSNVPSRNGVTKAVNEPLNLAFDIAFTPPGFDVHVFRWGSDIYERYRREKSDTEKAPHHK